MLEVAGFTPDAEKIEEGLKDAPVAAAIPPSCIAEGWADAAEVGCADMLLLNSDDVPVA